MSTVEASLRQALEKRGREQQRRTLSVSRGRIDFCSNDYLGFARSVSLIEKIRAMELRHHTPQLGAGGSRLLAGNSPLYEALEYTIAQFHHAEHGLIFNSGYTANLGFFSTIPQRKDTVLYDALAHASIRDGIQLNRGKSHAFRHNDLNDLEDKLKRAGGHIFVAVESIYSMDGDGAPLKELAALCRRYDARLVVDEAHATGVFGAAGKGMVAALGLENQVFGRIHTFGKALGCHGAIVVGSSLLRDYLINFSRPFIYTTALPFQALIAIKSAYEKLATAAQDIESLKALIDFFKESIKKKQLDHCMIASSSAIQCLMIPGNQRIRSLAEQVQQSGFDVRAIMHPTVPAGKERLRICIHAFNTREEIAALTDCLRQAVV